MSDQPVSLTPEPKGYAEALPNCEFVQGVLAQLPWYRQLALLEKLDNDEASRWYAAKVVDKQVKHEEDARTIGLLLCKSKNKVVAEYALHDKSKPIGIAEYQLAASLPEELKTSLPSIEQIERELEGSHE